MIAQKLDLLMKVTNVQNSTLGRALSFDSSYIGRIRTGKRGLPKNQPFIEPAAAFFARNLREPYQKMTIAEAICPGRRWPEDQKEAEALLIAWLNRNDSILSNPIGHILTSLSKTPGKRFSPQDFSFVPATGSAECTCFYYGNSGKRAAVEVFLSELCALNEPQTLLLYSDEDMSWLYEDPAFAKRWAGLLVELISKGGRIKIIHTVNRGIGEMLEAVQKWLPLYVSGAIEPYFYPKLRDGIYHRTLFIAQGRSALISNSVGNHTQEALNILVHDSNAVAALEAEFKDFFSLCKPLMRIFNLQNSDLFWEMLIEFEEGYGNLIVAHSVPSHFTMPESVAQSMSSRTGSKWLLRSQKESLARFEQNLQQGCTVTEVFNLPTQEQVKSSAIPVPMCDLFGQPTLCYTAEEFKAHMENVVELLRSKEGYHVVLSERAVHDVILFAKEDVGVIMSRSAPPSTVFGISEQSMTAAFWEYLQRLAGKTPSKEKTIAQLARYLHTL